MAKKYYAWKDPACGGVDIEWTELTGAEFYHMLKKEENRGRRFIRLGNDICPDDDTVIIEATEEEYRKWAKEREARRYLAKYERTAQITSLDAPVSGTDSTSLYELVGDGQVSVERKALASIAHEHLEQALQALTDEEARLLSDIYVQGRSAADIARELDVHRSTILRRLSVVIAKLEKFF